MAAALTHLLLALKVHKSRFSDKNREEYLVGTSFPDIRRLGRIPREKTHFLIETVEQTESDDAFTGGLLLHSYVDVSERKFARESGLEKLFPNTRFINESVKIFEDRILFKNFGNGSKYVQIFNKIYDQEKMYGVAETAIGIWHEMLIDCLTADMEDDEEKIRFIMGSGTSRDVVEQMVRESRQASNPDQAEQLVLEYYNGVK